MVLWQTKGKLQQLIDVPSSSNSRSVDFLAIEALLELFAKLLPSIQSPDGRKKRECFIRDVFDSALFPCSKEVVQLMGHTTTTDWNQISVKITDILAKTDISLSVSLAPPLITASY